MLKKKLNVLRGIVSKLFTDNEYQSLIVLHLYLKKISYINLLMNYILDFALKIMISMYNHIEHLNYVIHFL